jgi:hypothetical protein
MAFQMAKRQNVFRRFALGISHTISMEINMVSENRVPRIASFLIREVDDEPVDLEGPYFQIHPFSSFYGP